MHALSPPNIESELSYAYLHAVASHVGMSCHSANRHADNNGVDATVTAWGPFSGGGYLTEVDVKIQLKATISVPADDGANLSYFLQGTARYDDLRTETLQVPRLLVVLFLPKDSKEWLDHTVDQLMLRKCAYWRSLRGAPSVSTGTGTTVKLPKDQMFTPEGLLQLVTFFSWGKPLPYVEL